MQDLAESEPNWRIFLLRKNCDCTFHGKVPDTDKPLRFQNAHDFAQVLVADGEKRLALTWWEFVGGAVPAGFFEEGEWAIVGDEVITEKFVRRAEPLRE